MNHLNPNPINQSTQTQKQNFKYTLHLKLTFIKKNYTTLHISAEISKLLAQKKSSVRFYDQTPNYAIYDALL